MPDLIAVLITEADHPPVVRRGLELGDAARGLGYKACAFTDQMYAALQAGRMRNTFSRVAQLPAPTADGLMREIERLDGTAERLAGIVAVRDSAVPIANEASRRLGLPHLDPAALACATDKEHGRVAEQRAGLATPRWVRYSPAAGAEAAARQVGFPLVLKPVVGTSSRNTYYAENLGQLHAAINDAHDQLSRTTDQVTGVPGDPLAGFLLEEFIDGREFLVEAVVRDGEVEPAVVTERLGADGERITPGIGVWPPFDPDPTARVCQAVRDVAEAYGVDRGLLNAELRLRDGECYVIDVNVGWHNGWDGEEMARLCTGVDLRAEVVALATEAGPAPRVPVERPAGRTIARVPLDVAVPTGMESRAVETLAALPHVVSVAVEDQHRPGHPMPWVEPPQTLRRVVVDLPRAEAATPQAILALQRRLVGTAEQAVRIVGPLSSHGVARDGAGSGTSPAARRDIAVPRTGRGTTIGG